MDQKFAEAALAIAKGVTQAAVDAGHFQDAAERAAFTENLNQRLLGLYARPEAKTKPRTEESCEVLKLIPKPGYEASRIAFIAMRKD